MRFILEDGFWDVHMPLVHKLKLQFLSRFPFDHLAHRVVCSLIRFFN